MRVNFWIVLFAFVPAACITVNIYFPAPEVRQAAEEIVEETWGPESPHPQATKQSSWWRLLEPALAEAQEADINVSTAAIRALKESMRQRADQLKPFLTAGRVGIGRDGMLAVRGLEGVPLNEQATIRRLVDAENRDRTSLYREIAEANDFGSDRIPDIQRIFAETWIDKAEKGWPIQKPDGSWQTR
jgi:uncharacterized protein YdbL (DUF1318 family)